MKRELALNWLYGQLRQKRFALGRAERKPGVMAEEIESLENAIKIIEWIIGVVLEGKDDA
jgi:hypothetical protein